MTPPYDAVAASQALAAADPRLAEVIARVGPPTIEVRPDETLPALVRAVASQQLSVQAAATIHGRVIDAFAPGHPARPATAAASARLADALAGSVEAAPDGALRACGLSRAKAASVRDLVARYLDGRLPARADMDEMTDAEVVAALSAARGVGVWTAQMVLLFTLGRPDVWPVADLGVQEGVRVVAGLSVRPTAREMAALGAPYAPWRSVAAWYLWRAVELARAGAAQKVVGGG